MYFKKTRAKFLKWLVAATQAENERAEQEKAAEYANNAIVKSARDPELSSGKMTINVFPGNGGVAIETYCYDPRSDRSETVLHIIPESKDLGEAIAHIITLDSMRR